MTDKRNANMIISKAGGTAGKNSYNNKVSIPNVWAAAIGVTPDNKTLTLSFDGNRIIIEKAK